MLLEIQGFGKGVVLTKVVSDSSESNNCYRLTDTQLKLEMVFFIEGINCEWQCSIY